MAEPPLPPKPRALLPTLFMAFIFIVLLLVIFQQYSGGRRLSWGEFRTLLASGKIVRMTVRETGVDFEREQEDPGNASRQPVSGEVLYPGGRLTERNDNELQSARDQGNQVRLTQNKESIKEMGSSPPGPWVSMVPMIILFGAGLLMLWFLFFRRMGQGGGILNFGKSRAMLISKGKTGRTFKDVAGIDEAKEEVEELVEFLRDPRKFQRLGGRIPRGVLLVGPPGTGKTLLAKAIAGEADVPFFSISGSDFVEMFVGVGASRVRDLFQQAKDNAPCIIFIDEIDAVARRRGAGLSTGGHDEREQTLNAILVEMDGFSSNEKVIVLAATNRRDVLDPALLRPGRFDRHIHVELPDLDGREQILEVHAAKVKMSPDVDLTITARGTPGFSGADLENLINEAALHAARFNQEMVEQDDLEYARDRIAFGREKKTGSKGMPEDERRLTAFHEAGHASIQYLLEECDELHKVTIIPRGNYLGATFSLPTDRKSVSRRKLLGDICTLFGGRCAEERFCQDVTTGARQDIEMATRYARAMVYELGMSDSMGQVCYTVESEGWGGSERLIAVSEETRRELDLEVRRILDEQHARARRIIEEQSDTITRIANALLERETLLAEHIEILVKGGEIEPRVPTVTIRREPSEIKPSEVLPQAAGESGPALEPLT